MLIRLLCALSVVEEGCCFMHGSTDSDATDYITEPRIVPCRCPSETLWNSMYPSQNEACIVFDPTSCGVFLWGLAFSASWRKASCTCDVIKTESPSFVILVAW